MTAAHGLAWLRVALGVTALAAPGPLQTLAGLTRSSDPSTRLAWRFYGARALGLGVAWLSATDSARDHQSRAGLLVDVTDTTFLAAMAGRGSSPRAATYWLMSITGTAAYVGARELAGQRASTPGT